MGNCLSIAKSAKHTGSGTKKQILSADGQPGKDGGAPAAGKQAGASVARNRPVKDPLAGGRLGRITEDIGGNEETHVTEFI